MISDISHVRDGAAVCFFDIDGTLIRTSKESETVDEAPLPQVADAIRAVGDVNHDGVAEALERTRHLWQ